MSDNVIILGAGFSYDANIPLLSSFVERMWEYSIRKYANKEAITSVDQEKLRKALLIRAELDGYHGRVSFDDRNIEDILSMLTFNVLGGGKKDKEKFSNFIRAISATIELSCNIKHPGLPEPRKNYSIIEDGSFIYRDFWKGIFNWTEYDNDIPTIITFNYDLVLERSLFQTLINTYYGHHKRFPFDIFSLDYKFQNYKPEFYKVNYSTFGAYSSPKNGTTITKLQSSEVDNCTSINLLKLHGSLNFPQSLTKEENTVQTLTKAIENPYILPPVSNKNTTRLGEDSWKTALNSLRSAKNITFVGYSLPKTDMYMQFFLKAALGPNQELNKISVFDPVLFHDSKESNEMKQRYKECFSEQIRPRINFCPSPIFDKNGNLKDKSGTTEHFVHVLRNSPSDILF